MIGLQEKKVIESFDDLSTKVDGFRFKIKITREKYKKLKTSGKLLSKFKLTANLNENLNALTEDDLLKTFKSVNEIIEYFVDFRMKILTKRKQIFKRSEI